MEKMNDLKDLLKHEVQDLYSAEEQIIAALPMMIDKAKNPELKKSLQDHLRVTQQQRSRLEQVQHMLGEEQQNGDEKKGLLTRLFKGRQVCKGMQGLIEEGNKVMREEMHPDVLDAAIIACAQKIEHYEICGYGTARSFSRELGIEEITRLLEQTLNEEYAADDQLTQLAVSRINKQAEKASSGPSPSTTTRSGASRAGGGIRSLKEEPEMEMATSSRSGSAGKKTTTPARGSAGTAAPRAADAARSSTGSGRTTSSSRKATAENRSAGRNAGTGGRTSGTGSRGGNSGRGNSRGR